MPVLCVRIPVVPATTGWWPAVLEALDAASPLVEDAAPGLALLEMHGIEGGARGWLRAVRQALTEFAADLQLGVGPNRFVAYAASTVGPEAVCATDAAAFLAPLPLTLLAADGLDDDLRLRLRRLGVTTLGALAALPHGPFVRRFGPLAEIWHERARGIDRRPLTPRPRALRIDRARYGEGEATSEEAVLFALRALVDHVADDLGAAGKRSGRLVLALECENGDVRIITTAVAQPTAVPTTLFGLLRARIEGVTLEAAVVGLRLSAERLEDGGVPLSLFAVDDPDPDALGVVLARIDAALGEGRALRPRVIDGPRIERRFVMQPFGLEPLTTKTWHAQCDALPSHATLQLRTIAPQALAVRVVNGRPHGVGTPFAPVLDVAGPWRVDEGWWASATAAGQLLVRDEYDVLLADGALLRIAREPDGWYLRGVYD